MEVKKEYKSKILKLIKKKGKCPTCKKKPNDTFFPFCSKKCTDLDLIKWFPD